MDIAITAALIGGVFTITAAIIPIYYKKKRELPKINIDDGSKYTVYKISNIIKNELCQVGLNVDSFSFMPNFSVLDLKTYCKKIYYPNYPEEKIDLYIDSAREKAYSLKYSNPEEDEKLVPISRIKINNIIPWENYIITILKDQGLTDYYNYRILDIGIGNGFSTENFYRNCKNLTGIDISNKSLKYAKQKHPNARLINNQAEDLYAISNSSIDIIFAFRVFQSTLFDKKMAFSEAFRVLSSGGTMILSIPIMFLKENGEVLSGLIPPDQEKPSMEYAILIAQYFKDLMTTMNFKNVNILSDSPFELYISGKRP